MYVCVFGIIFHFVHFVCVCAFVEHRYQKRFELINNDLLVCLCVNVFVDVYVRTCMDHQDNFR